MFAIDAYQEVGTTQAATRVTCRSVGAPFLSTNTDEGLTFLHVIFSATDTHTKVFPLSEVRWERFGGSAYLFAIDAHREVDTTRAAASVICRSMGAALVSINSDEELTFLQVSHDSKFLK